MQNKFLFKTGTSLLSQFFNYKAAQQEFKNPILNALQMGIMMSGTADLFNQRKPWEDELKKPFLYAFTIGMDDFLINSGWTNKHHLTNIASAVDFSDHLKESLMMENANKAYMLHAAFGVLGLKYLQEYYTGSKGFIGTMRDVQLKLNRNIEEIEYTTDGAVSAKMAITTQVVINKLIDSQALQLPQEIAVYKNSVVKPLINGSIGVLLGASGFQRIKDKNQEILKSPMSLLKISSESKHSQTLQDLDKISVESSDTLLSSMMINGGLIGINEAFNSSKGLFPVSNLMSFAGEIYQRANYVDKIAQLQKYTIAGSKIKTGLINSPRTIIERDGLGYFSHKSSDLDEKQKQIIESIESDKLKATGMYLLSFVKNMFLGSLNMNSTGDNLAQILEHYVAMTHLDTSIMNLSTVIQNEPSLRSLSSLYKFLETVKNTSYVTYQNHDYESLKGLYLKNLDIRINGIDKLHMDDLFLESGNWYLLTGKSGCGKTTLMSTLRGLPNFAEAIEITGDAFYPKTTSDGKPQIYMLTQNNNFPYMVSIMEAILYPMITTETERVSYKGLVEEIMLKMDGITRDSEDGKEYLESGLLSRLFEIENDIYSVTSGGQQKKMSLTGLIVRIMKETGMLDIYNVKISGGSTHDEAMKVAKDSVGPVLILIDEVFNGLDSGMSSAGFASSSKGYVMQTLKDSLPTKAIVVSVEHQAQLDQYDHRIHLNGDGSHNFTDPKTGYVEPMNTFDTDALQAESFDPFAEIMSADA